MVTRQALTARFWLASAVGSMLYLHPATLGFSSACAYSPAWSTYYNRLKIYDFKGRSELGGHPDFDWPTAASAGIPGLYTAGLVDGDVDDDGIDFVFETHATLDWLDLKTLITDTVFGLDFPVSKNVGFAAAGVGGAVNTGRILKTTNNGNDWTTVQSFAKRLCDIDMVDDNVGWAIGVQGLLAKTTDGWASYTTYDLGAYAPLTLWGMHALDASTAFIAAGAGRVFRTTDGGTTWLPADTGAARPLYGISFADALTGWAVGGSTGPAYNNGGIWKSEDGGATWVPQLLVPLPTALCDVWAHDAARAWAVGWAGSIMTTSDGTAWSAQASGTASGLNAVCFSDDGLFGLAVGDGGVMRQTVNGGATWTATPRIGGTANLHDILYIPAAQISGPPMMPTTYVATGFTGGQGGVIKRRLNSGVQITVPWTNAGAEEQSRQMHAAAAGDATGGHGTMHNAFVASPATGVQWFSDVLGVNMSSVIDIEFNQVGTGPSAYYVFDPIPFYPIDDMLMGNPPGQHNDLFTVEAEWLLEYDATAGQWLNILSNGDTWVTLHNYLVIDMGGTHDETSQYVDVDRLGLEKGRVYKLKITVAYRQKDVDPRLRITTNALLTTDGTPSVKDAVD